MSTNASGKTVEFSTCLFIEENTLKKIGEIFSIDAAEAEKKYKNI